MTGLSVVTSGFFIGCAGDVTALVFSLYAFDRDGEIVCGNFGSNDSALVVVVSIRVLFSDALLSVFESPVYGISKIPIDSHKSNLLFI